MSGVNTSEFEITKSAGLWGSVAMILGLIVSVGGDIAANLGAESVASVYVGITIAIAGAVLRGLTTLGYTKSRETIKIAGATGMDGKGEAPKGPVV